MHKTEFSHLIDSLTPKLWSLAIAIDPRPIEAQSLITDSYTVFLLKEKQFLTNGDYGYKTQEEKFGLRKYLLNELIRELYELAQTRVAAKKFSESLGHEFSDFYSLKLKSRVVLFLKEKFHFSTEEIQEIFCWQRHEVLENFYNARNELLKVAEDTLLKKEEDNILRKKENHHGL